MPVMKKDIDILQGQITAIKAEMAECKAKGEAELIAFKAATLRQFKLIEAKSKSLVPMKPPKTWNPKPVGASVSRFTEKPPKPKKK